MTESQTDTPEPPVRASGSEPPRAKREQLMGGILREVAIGVIAALVASAGTYWLTVHGQMASFEERLAGHGNDIGDLKAQGLATIVRTLEERLGNQEKTVTELKGEGLATLVSGLSERVRTLETVGMETTNVNNLINLMHSDISALEVKVESVQKELSAAAAISKDHTEEISALRCGCNGLLEKIATIREKIAVLDALQNGKREALVSAEK